MAKKREAKREGLFRWLGGHGVVVLLVGHIWLAFRHPQARAAMRRGSIDADYAEREHPAWAATSRSTPIRR